MPRHFTTQLGDSEGVKSERLKFAKTSSNCRDVLKLHCTKWLKKFNHGREKKNSGNVKINEDE